MAQRQLIERLSGRTFLRSRWREVNRSNPKSHGLSGLTISEFAQGLPSHIDRLNRELRAGMFRFRPQRGVTIPKDGKPGERRPLQIAEIEDRLVSRGIVHLIERDLTKAHKISPKVSFAYSHRSGVRDAIAQTIRLYHTHKSWVLEADIERFFDTLDKEMLLEKLVYPHLRDDTLNPLLRDALEQPVGNLADIGDELHHLFSDSGIPQGNALSPLFANVYLASFDNRMTRAGYALVRYADDFIVLCATRNEAHAAHDLAKAILQDELGLKIHPLSSDPKGKTRITRVSTGFSFLGVKFDGTRLYPSEKSRARLNARLKDAADTSRNTSVLDILKRTDHVLTGWVEAYAHCDLAPHLEDIDDTVNRCLARSLRDLGWPVTRDNRLPPRARKTSGVPLARTLLSEARTRLRRGDTRKRPRRMLTRDDHFELFSSTWPTNASPATTPLVAAQPARSAS